jgi:hypothetical protein
MDETSPMTAATSAIAVRLGFWQVRFRYKFEKAADASNSKANHEAGELPIRGVVFIV